MKVLLCFSEFGRPFIGHETIPEWKRIWPDAEVHFYTDDVQNANSHMPDLVKVVDAPFDKAHPRYGWRAQDWAKGFILSNTAQDEVRIALDGDMWPVDGRAKALVELASKFGLCLPANDRQVVCQDTGIGFDVADRTLDATHGTGYAYNCGIMAAAGDMGNDKRALLQEFMCEIERTPVRGPVAWWRAVYTTGVYPYLLPPQWCITSELIGIRAPLVLHIGHKDVKAHYSIGSPS